jgi:hypothetical protein
MIKRGKGGMDDRLVAGEEEDLLMERLIQVENALFFLKVKSCSVEGWDGGGEVERLERMRRELHESYARIYRPSPDELMRADTHSAVASSG